MGTTIVDNTGTQRAKPVKDLHNMFKGYSPLSVFRFKMQKSHVAATPEQLRSILFIKLSGNNYMSLESKLVYKIKSDKFHIKSSVEDFDSYYLYEMEPLKAIINVSKEY